MLNSSQIARVRDLEKRYKRFYETPDKAEPLFIVNVAPKGPVNWKERIADPRVMLAGELENIAPHLELEDDFIPMVRVQFGTPQVAAAFGAEIHVFDDSLPAAKTHPLTNIADVDSLPMPGLASGWFGKLKEYTAYFKAHLPKGVVVQLPDIQSPFNSAHLIRGDDLFVDFYDNPDAVGRLLDKVTDYMITLVPYLMAMISDDREWFHDWGGLWKGNARISNCSMQMISPSFYMDHVFPRDERLLKGIGNGRIHYCGKTQEVLKRFLTLPGVSAVDYDPDYHDLDELCALAAPQTALFQRLKPGTPLAERLLKGDWPRKKNILFVVPVATIEEGKAFLRDIRRSRS